jgi:GxxExxY protein
MNADVAQMDADSVRVRLNELSRAIIGSAQVVSTRLGAGFLEKVYENALCRDLQRRRIAVAQQHPIHVHFDGVVVGDYIADLLVEDSVIVEVKAIDALNRVHRQQCLNYLRGTNLRLGLVLNFGRPHLEIARVVCNF